MAKRSIMLVAAICLAAGAAISAPLRQAVPVIHAAQVFDTNGSPVDGKYIAGIQFGFDAKAPTAFFVCDRINDDVPTCKKVKPEDAAKEGFVVAGR